MRTLLLILLITCGIDISILDAQLSDSATISILTVRQGDRIDNKFGHTAIWVVDPITKRSEIYNYGGFNFNEPGFTMKFLRGKLLYSLFIERKKDFFDNYYSQKRTILEQKLNLNTDERNAIYLALRENYKKENRKYLYDFFFDNCSTRPRDLLYQNLNLSEADSDVPDKTFRDLIDEYVFSSPWMDFGIDLIIGKKADKIASIQDQMYLPEYFYKKLNKLNTNGQPLVSSAQIVLDFESQAGARKQKSWLSPALVFSLLLLLELIFFLKYKKKNQPKFLAAYATLWYLLAAISSLIVLFMWFGSDHIATNDNLNVLWLNPLFFIILFSRNKWIHIVLAFFLVIALIAGSTLQQFHMASIILICILLLKIARGIR